MYWVQTLAVVFLLALCHAAEEENLNPITERQDEAAFTLGYNGHDYVLVKSRKFYHQTQAEKYCLYHHRMRLARVPDEDTRRALQSSLFNIQRNQGYTLKSIAIAERTNQPIHTGDDVPFEDLNPAGATCVALGAQNIDPETGVNGWDGDQLLLLTRECNIKRTILCEDYSYCD